MYFHEVETARLLKMRSDLAAIRFDLALRRMERSQKFDPAQPRVPAGGPDGGQWAGAQVSGRFDILDAVEEAAKFLDGLLKSGLADALSAIDAEDEDATDSFEFVANDSDLEPTGDPRIDAMSYFLHQLLKEVGNAVGEGKGRLYGAFVHLVFATVLKRLNVPGIGTDGVEQTFYLGITRNYGLSGSIRTDVVLRDPSDVSKKPIAVWDVKTGSARLTSARSKEIRLHLKAGDDLPVMELHVMRPVSRKQEAFRTLMLDLI